MSKSPAMINRAKRTPEALLKFRFNRKDVKFPVPIRPVISVKDLLNKFAEKGIRAHTEYSDLELYTKNKIRVSYDELINEQFFEEKYSLYRSNLTPNIIAAKTGLRNYTDFDIVSEFESGLVINRKQNFFTYLIDKYPQFKISLTDMKEFTSEVKNVFNSDEALKQIEENKSKYQNQWLYNKHTFNNVSLLNYFKWDENFYKNLLTQLISPVTNLRGDLILDVDTTIKGLDTKERKVDIMIKNKDNSKMIPLNILPDLDEVEIYNRTRSPFYDYMFPKKYPMFLYELVNPENPEDLTPDVIKMADSVSKEGSVNFKQEFINELFEEFENSSFTNFDVLKTISKNRFAMSKRLHFGITAHNDKIRFNLYFRPQFRQLENVLSLHRSQIFDLGFDLKTHAITNAQQYVDFLSTFNALSNISPLELDSLYEDFQRNSNQSLLLQTVLNENHTKEIADQKDNPQTKVRKFKKFKI